MRCTQSQIWEVSHESLTLKFLIQKIWNQFLLESNLIWNKYKATIKQKVSDIARTESVTSKCLQLESNDELSEGITLVKINSTENEHFFAADDILDKSKRHSSEVGTIPFQHFAKGPTSTKERTSLFQFDNEVEDVNEKPKRRSNSMGKEGWTGDESISK